MTGICCKRCQGNVYVKRGIVRGKQRYLCKACGYNFTATPPRGKHPAMKALTILLYSMGNMSYRMIARLLGTSHVSVYEWIKAEAEKLPEPGMPANVQLVNIDEMWHFLQKKHKNSGSGERLILLSGAFFPGFWGAVMMQPAKGFSIKSA